MIQSAEQVRAAIAELQALPRADLVARFRRLYRADPPQQISRDLLLRAISWRLQKKAAGKQDRAVQRRLQKLATEFRQTGSIALTQTSMPTASLKPGTRLVREWQGVVHEVSVTEEGFVYRDQRYRSLSQVARAITGTRWSGPSFFGLNGAAAGKGGRTGRAPAILCPLAMPVPATFESRMPRPGYLMPRKTKRFRCAVYTRKSSEEGLEQAFNSLDAQYEACAAYITSQRHEGWTPIDQRYDDGGLSGGTLERPALQRLLDDIKSNRVDIVVVYKVDRLTRSLSDFAKMVEIFDANQVSFVSITQAFNTTTSMGRLTLNVLLSFAQFEREVTAERIRDKVAASKKKGMWMGGHVPLGYDVVDRKLVINQGEAKTVRTLFALYLDQGSARAVQSAANQHGLRTKARKTKVGKMSGGAPLTRGHIYQILSNPLYVGEIRHKGAIYPGQHDAIIERSVWDAVQQKLADNRVNRRNGKNAKEPSLLAGLLFDSKGNRFTPTHAVKHGRRYRYYIDRALITVRSDGNSRGKRIAADEIERAVATALADYLRRPDQLLASIDTDDLAPELYQAAIAAAQASTQTLANGHDQSRREVVTTLIERIVIGEGRLRIDVRQAGVASLLGLGGLASLDDKDDQIDEIEVPLQLRYRGGAMKLVMTGEGQKLSRRPDAALIKLIVRAHDWWARLLTGEAKSTEDIARAENLSRRYVNQLLRLAFLDPSITSSILDGTQPVELTAKTLSNRPTIPLLWAEQRPFLGFDQHR